MTKFQEKSESRPSGHEPRPLIDLLISIILPSIVLMKFSGDAELGYGDGDEQTVVSYGPDSGNKYITTYFRHEFTVTDAASLGGLTLRIQRDDGAVVYLNGHEVRFNMLGGAVDYLTRSATTVGLGCEIRVRRVL